MLTSGRTLCRRRAKRHLSRKLRAEIIPDIGCNGPGVSDTTARIRVTKIFPLHPGLYARLPRKNQPFFCPGLCRRVSGLIEMPGRGLEPLWISPPDPKSGASANFATPANFKAHERRFVAPFGQIALERLLRFLRQIGQCLRKTSPDPFSSRSLSAHRDKAA